MYQESKKSCRSVWKNMSDSPIIFHICGDTHMECCRRNLHNDTQRPTSSECRRNSNINFRRSTSSECRKNSNNYTLCPASSECRRNSNNDTGRPTSSKCRRNSNNDFWCSTSSECRRNPANDTRCPTSSECRHKSNNDIRRPTLSDHWHSLAKIPPKESSTEKSTSTLWPEELRFSFSEDDAFTNCRKVTNPMLKLANYIDTLLKDVGDNL